MKKKQEVFKLLTKMYSDKTIPIHIITTTEIDSIFTAANNIVVSIKKNLKKMSEQLTAKYLKETDKSDFDNSVNTAIDTIDFTSLDIANIYQSLYENSQTIINIKNTQNLILKNFKRSDGGNLVLKYKE